MSTGSSGADTGETLVETEESNLQWRECFADAIRYFHGQIDEPIRDHTETGGNPNRAETARDYFNERGWDEETIKRHLLGWAPPADKNELNDHLAQEDYTEKERLATGLFTEDLRPLWQGRYVFTYLGDNHRPAYAISRCTGRKGGGNVGYDGHPDDFIRGKYGKLAHTKEYARASEPIFGRESVRDGESVVITEGIADAITIQQAGYACVSPVTTQFSQDARADLLALLEANNVSRVFVLQDAERPSVEFDRDTDRLDLTQLGSGVTGAIDTATFLSENGVDARVATPPRAGLRKVDVDDYLQDGWGSVDALRRSAKPPQQHPAYSEEEQPQRDSLSSDGTEAPPSTDAQSALFTLDITDVTGLSTGFRGTNPLGHTGDSEDYFVVGSSEWAYDHKRQVPYNALTYLLCDAGERSLDSPGGSLSDRERFVAWKHAKTNGLVSELDPIPHHGLIYIAVENGLCERDEIVDGWKLPIEAYNTALDVVREEYGLNPGREPYEGESQENLSRVPVVTDDAPDTATMTMDDAYDRCQAVIDRALAQSQFSLIDALPAQGKSRGVIKWAAQNDTAVTVLAPRRELLSDEYGEWCEEFQLEYYKAPAFHRDCGCAAGNHGETWRDRVRKLYRAGVTASEIHALAERRYGTSPPCQENGPCPYISKGDFDPEDYDVLLGHYTHAYRDDMTDERVVVIDEAPADAFVEEFDPETVETAVNQYLKRHSAIPFTDYTDLVTNRDDPYRRDDALDWFRQHGEAQRDGFAVMVNSAEDLHAFAPLMTYALLTGTELGNGWERAALSEGRVGARNRHPSQEHEEAELCLLNPPSLEDAERVIGLDGTPWIAQWELCLGDAMTHYQVLDSDERRAYLQEALNLTIFLMSDAAKSYASGTWIQSKQLKDDAALLKYVGKEERQLPDLISSKTALSKYEDADMLDLVRNCEYYGDLKGTNTFEDSRVGVVIGSLHYGDTHLKKWGALAGETVERVGDGKGMNLDYGSFGNDILQDMRENEVLQAVMRFGRDGDGARVYVSTAALPKWVPVAGKGEVHKWSSGMRQLLGVLRDSEDDEWRTGDLFEEGETPTLAGTDSDSVSKRQTRRNLTTLYELGFLDRRKENCGWVWEDVDLAAVNDDREVVFEG